MYRSLTASDRQALVRLASQLPKGGKHRRAILASLSAKPDARALLTELESLGMLDSNLTDMEDTFEANFRLASGISPEVASQFEMLKKARTGLKTAKAILQNAQILVDAFPDDKTAARALKDAGVMIRRFEGHEAKAAKIIRTLSKKALPPALAKAARQYGSALKKLLDDPKVLQILPWQGDRLSSTGRSGVIYQVVFRIEQQPGLHVKRAEVILFQNTGDTKGPQYSGYTLGNQGTLKSGPYKLSEALSIMKEQLRGYPGLKGEAGAAAARKRLIPKIKARLDAAADQVSYRVEDPEVDRNTVSISFRTDINSANYGQYDDTADRLADEQLQPAFTAALRGIEGIKNVRLSEGEKGWWSYYVVLK